MANRNYTKKIKTASGYDVMYPKTTAQQVITDATKRFTSDAEMDEKVQKSGDKINGSLEVTEQIKGKWIQQGNFVEAYLGIVKTTAGVANQKAYLILGKKLLTGWIEVEIASHFYYDNSMGRLCKRFNIIASAAGVRNRYDAFYTFADPAISTNFGIGDFVWDETYGWIIKIGKRALGEENSYHVFLRAFGCDVPQSELTSLSTEIYTTDATAFPEPIVTFPGNIRAKNLKTDISNAILGIDSGIALNTGESNTLIGTFTGRAMTTGANNTVCGHHAGLEITTGGSNTLIGRGAGAAIKTGNQNILIGYDVFGDSATESNVVRLGKPIYITKCFLAGIYGATSASGVNVLINSSHQLGTTTSSKRYKKNIEDIQQKYVDKYFDEARPIWYQSNTELCLNDDPDFGWWGILAEELAKVDPRLVHFDYHEEDYEIVQKSELVQNPDYDIYLEKLEKGEIDENTKAPPIEIERIYDEKVLKQGAEKSPRAVHYERITMLLTKEIQRMRKREKWKTKIRKAQNKRIKELEANMTDLKERFEKLESILLQNKI